MEMAPEAEGQQVDRTTASLYGESSSSVHRSCRCEAEGGRFYHNSEELECQGQDGVEAG